MITIEKDLNAEEIFIHAAPEGLREFARTLWEIADKSETKGKHKKQLTTTGDTGSDLFAQLQGEPGKHSVIKKLTISSRVD